MVPEDDDPFALSKPEERRGRPATGEGEVLTPQLKALVDEYLVDFRLGPAARRAGYGHSMHSARVHASKRLNDPAAQRYLAERLEERKAERVAMEQRIIDELERLAYLDLTDVLDEFGEISMAAISALPDDRRTEVLAAVQSHRTSPNGSVTLKFHDKVRAIELLGRHAGMFVERKEISGPGGGPIKVAPGMTPAEAAAAYAASLAET